MPMCQHVNKHTHNDHTAHCHLQKVKRIVQNVYVSGTIVSLRVVIMFKVPDEFKIYAYFLIP